jgi:hypothetical protein
LLLAIGTIDGLWLVALNHLQGWSDDIWMAVKRSTETQRLFFIAIALVVISIFAVARTAKS